MDANGLTALVAQCSAGTGGSVRLIADERPGTAAQALSQLLDPTADGKPCLWRRIMAAGRYAEVS
eukprot:416716-Prorocentrum_minimum.AAC.1